MTPEPNELTALLTSAPSETEAAIVVAALEENGIRASSDEYTSGLRAGPWNWVNIMAVELGQYHGGRAGPRAGERGAG
jgi:hypothetical protein